MANGDARDGDPGSAGSDPWGAPSPPPGAAGGHPGGQPGHGPPYGQPGYGPGYGYPQQPYGYPPRGAATNGFAIASLVCAFLCSPLGLIFGFVARSQIRQTGEAGDGLALAGIIVSAVFLIGTIIAWIAVATMVTSVGGSFVVP